VWDVDSIRKNYVGKKATYSAVEANRKTKKKASSQTSIIQVNQGSTPAPTETRRGEKGSGKTTWINPTIYYVLGVEFEDNFRFKLVKQ
jgi:hypothetical protein